ncbi:MAG: DNA-binding protein, partial [Deltaproteobacteria bacterium]|nr:DNA-binding protein [Deltaproteobacteria bacterium]
ALILLDGADTPLLHMVDATDESSMSTGMRVKVRWARETKGSITDIECFEPV